MSKKTLKGRKQIRAGVGKIYGRSRGELVYNDIVGCKVTQKIDEAIKFNRESKSESSG